MKKTKRIREKTVSLRVTLDEYEVLQDLADYKGVDMSDILRLPVIDELNRRQEAIAS
jgi:uncharacterized protein (DUF1778 family)